MINSSFLFTVCDYETSVTECTGIVISSTTISVTTVPTVSLSTGLVTQSTTKPTVIINTSSTTSSPGGGFTCGTTEGYFGVPGQCIATYYACFAGVAYQQVIS